MILIRPRLSVSEVLGHVKQMLSQSNSYKKKCVACECNSSFSSSSTPLLTFVYVRAWVLVAGGVAMGWVGGIVVLQSWSQIRGMLAINNLINILPASAFRVRRSAGTSDVDLELPSPTAK